MKTSNQLVNANFANVHWSHDLNFRKSAKSFGNPISDVGYRIETDDNGEKVVNQTKDGLVFALRNGWDTTQGVVSAERATKDDVSRAIKERRERIDQLKQRQDTLPLAMVLEDIWFPVDPKSGKSSPVAVEWIANNCYRRSRGVEGVLLRRRNDDVKTWDRTFVVPILPKEFGDGTAGKIAKLDDHVLENTLKLVGRKEMQPVDFFHLAAEYKSLYGELAKESDLIRRHVKRGEAQRAFALACIHSDFPELALLTRTTGGPPVVPDGETNVPGWQPGKSWIDVSKLRHSDVVRLKSGYKAGTTGDRPECKIPGGRAGKLAALEAYFRQAMEGTKDKVLTSGKIVEVANDSPCYLMQYLGARLGANDGNFSRIFKEHAKEINKALMFLTKLDDSYATLVKTQQEVAKAAAAD